eukprot:5108686-Pleurochrysis_carterae.AAC.1
MREGERGRRMAEGNQGRKSVHCQCECMHADLRVARGPGCGSGRMEVGRAAGAGNRAGKWRGGWARARMRTTCSIQAGTRTHAATRCCVRAFVVCVRAFAVCATVRLYASARA